MLASCVFALYVISKEADGTSITSLCISAVEVIGSREVVLFNKTSNDVVYIALRLDYCIEILSRVCGMLCLIDR